jgi:hypothetical protein
MTPLKTVTGILSRATITVSKLGAKTTCVHVRLKNGYEITETAACVDPANYDEAVGKRIALKRVEDRLWQLEGWALTCREDGLP